MLCPSLLISINELLISIISFIDINKYGLNVKMAAHIFQWLRNKINTLETNSVHYYNDEHATFLIFLRGGVLESVVLAYSVSVSMNVKQRGHIAGFSNRS